MLMSFDCVILQNYHYSHQSNCTTKHDLTSEMNLNYNGHWIWAYCCTSQQSFWNLPHKRLWTTLPSIKDINADKALMKHNTWTDRIDQVMATWNLTRVKRNLRGLGEKWWNSACNFFYKQVTQDLKKGEEIDLQTSWTFKRSQNSADHKWIRKKGSPLPARYHATGAD